MGKDSVMRQWTGVIAFATVLLGTSLAGAAVPLQKIVFLFSGCNERTSFIFVAKDRFVEEQGRCDSV